MSEPDFYTILDDCLARQRRGEALEVCLADYPAQASELTPVLALSADLLQLPRLEPSSQVFASGYETMMESVSTRERPSWLAKAILLGNSLWSSFNPRGSVGLPLTMRVAMVFMIVLVAGSAFAVTASADSLPGDALYPVKRSWENTRLALTLSEPSRRALESEFAEERRAEVQAVIELGRPVIVEFQGTLRTTGEAWMVDGLSVEVDGETEMTGDVTVGQPITVRAQVQTDGKLVGLKIVGKGTGQGSPTDLPSIRPTDEPAFTLEPRPTAEQTATMGPTATLKPTLTREPTATRQPSTNLATRPTAEPTATREPVLTSAATATRETDSALTRELTATPEPTPTPTTKPNDTLTDRATPTREQRPTPTPTDKPADVTRPSSEPTRDVKPTPEPTPTPGPDSALTREPTATSESRPTPTKGSDKEV